MGGYRAWSVGGFLGDQVMLTRTVEVGSPSPISQPVTWAYERPGADPEPFATFPAGSLARPRGPGQLVIAIG